MTNWLMLTQQEACAALGDGILPLANIYNVYLRSNFTHCLDST